MQTLAAHLAAAFSALFGAGIRRRAVFSAVLQEALLANAGVLATWSVWEPDAIDGDDANFRHAAGHDASGRFVPCWHRAGGQPALIATTGYETPAEGDWYWVPKKELTACTLESIEYRYGPALVWISSHIVPLVFEGRFHGAVGVDLKVPRSRVRRAADGANARQRAPTRPLAASTLARLSPREREVFHWLALGKSNEDIAAILAISPHTVKNHLDHVFRKLGVRNRFEAVRAAH